MDTMDIKHIKCFGPCMVEEWGLSEWEAPIDSFCGLFDTRL